MQIYSPALTQKLDHISCFGLCEDAMCVWGKKTGFSEQLLDFNILQLADSKDSALFSEEKVESTF